MSWWGKMVDSLTGGDAKRAAKREAAKADERTQRGGGAEEQLAKLQGIQVQRSEAELAELNDNRQRWNEYYAPMERQLVGDLNKGPDLEGESALAAGRFSSDFDASTDAARRQAMRYGIQPGSEQMRRTEDANAYDRARGIAGSANTARRAEDDAHWLKQSAFFNQNGSGLKRDVLAGIQNMYGSQANAVKDQANGLQGFAQQYQNNSDRFSQEAASTLSSTVNLATQGALAFGTGGASLLGQGAGAIGSYFGGRGVSDTELAATQAELGAMRVENNINPPTASTSRWNYDGAPQAISTRINGPNSGAFMNDGGYGGVSGNGFNGNTAGNVQGAINWREGQ